MRKVPGVIIKSKFKLPNAKRKARRYTSYLSYIDRPETKSGAHDFENYHDYMEDERKSSGLFTHDLDQLDAQQRQQVREVFRQAQANGSVLWQDVISFDDAWLQEVGVRQGRFIDDKRLIQATRKAVNAMLEREQMTHAFWTGAIHYNTDNIHVHIATVETLRPRERGKRKPKTIEKMKSQVIHSLADRTHEQEKLNDFIRSEVVAHKRNRSLDSPYNRVLHPALLQQFKAIRRQLPDDRRQWHYQMNGMKSLRPEIDRLTDAYINSYFPNAFADFQKRLDQEVSFYERSYGSAAQAARYRETKEHDLYKRMGNAILTEMREQSKQDEKECGPRKLPSRSVRIRQAFRRERLLQESVYHIERHMNDEWEHIKNQRAFNQLEHELDQER